MLHMPISRVFNVQDQQLPRIHIKKANMCKQRRKRRCRVQFPLPRRAFYGQKLTLLPFMQLYGKHTRITARFNLVTALHLKREAPRHVTAPIFIYRLSQVTLDDGSPPLFVAAIVHDSVLEESWICCVNACTSNEIIRLVHHASLRTLRACTAEEAEAIDGNALRRVVRLCRFSLDGRQYQRDVSVSGARMPVQRRRECWDNAFWTESKPRRYRSWSPSRLDPATRSDADAAAAAVCSQMSKDSMLLWLWRRGQDTSLASSNLRSKILIARWVVRVLNYSIGQEDSSRITPKCRRRRPKRKRSRSSIEPEDRRRLVVKGTKITKIGRGQHLVHQNVRLRSGHVRQSLPNAVLLLERALLTRDWATVASIMLAVSNLHEHIPMEILEATSELAARTSADQSSNSQRARDRLEKLLRSLSSTQSQDRRRVALEIGYASMVDGDFSSAQTHLTSALTHRFMSGVDEADGLLGVARVHAAEAMHQRLAEIQMKVSHSSRIKKQLGALVSRAVGSLARAMRACANIPAKAPLLGAYAEYVWRLLIRGYPMTAPAARKAVEAMRSIADAKAPQCPNVLGILLRIRRELDAERDAGGADEAFGFFNETETSQHNTSKARAQLRRDLPPLKSIATNLFEVDPTDDAAYGVLIAQGSTVDRVRVIMARLDVKPGGLRPWAALARALASAELFSDEKLRTRVAEMAEERLSWWPRSPRHLGGAARGTGERGQCISRVRSSLERLASVLAGRGRSVVV